MSPLFVTVPPDNRAPAPCRLMIPAFVKLPDIDKVLVGPTFMMPPTLLLLRFVRTSVPPGFVELITPPALLPLVLNPVSVPAPWMMPSLVDELATDNTPSTISVP